MWLCYLSDMLSLSANNVGKDFRMKMQNQERNPADTEPEFGGEKKRNTTTEITEQVRIRDNYQCRVCGALSIHVHHIRFKSKGGKDELDNLVSLCFACHAAVHDHKIKLYVSYNPFEVFVENLK